MVVLSRFTPGMESGSARLEIDLEAYREKLRRLTDPTRAFVSMAIAKAKTERPRVAFPEGTDRRVIRAADRVELVRMG